MQTLDEQLQLLRGQVCEGGVCKTTLSDLPIDEATSRAYLRSKLLTESSGSVVVAEAAVEHCPCETVEVSDELLNRLGNVLREEKKRKALETFLEAIQ